MNAWQLEQSKIREITRQTAGMVATELGEGWKVDTDSRFDEFRVVYLDGPDGARITVALDWRNTDRVEVSGVFPEGARNVYPSAERTEIGVRRDRGPAVIAREITRRLLPAYLTELERVTAGVNRDVDARATRERVAGELAALVPSASLPTHRQTDSRASVWLPDGTADISYAGDSVSLELRTVPLAVARRILAVYADSLAAGK